MANRYIRRGAFVEDVEVVCKSMDVTVSTSFSVRETVIRARKHIPGTKASCHNELGTVGSADIILEPLNRLKSDRQRVTIRGAQRGRVEGMQHNTSTLSEESAR